MKKDNKKKEKNKGIIIIIILNLFGFISSIISIYFKISYEEFQCSLMAGTYSDNLAIIYDRNNVDRILGVACSVIELSLLITFVLVLVFLIKKDKKNMIRTIISVILLLVYFVIAIVPLASTCV